MMGPGKLLGSDSVSFKKSASQVPHNAMSRIFIVIRNIQIAGSLSDGCIQLPSDQKITL